MSAMNDHLITTATELGLDVDHPAVAAVAAHNADPAARRNNGTVSALMALEDGELGPLETLLLFGQFIATGQAWTLQGRYGRAAASMIDAGLLDEAGKIICDSPSVQHALAFDAALDV